MVWRGDGLVSDCTRDAAEARHDSGIDHRREREHDTKTMIFSAAIQRVATRRASLPAVSCFCDGCAIAEDAAEGSATSARTVLGANQKAWLKSRLLAGSWKDLIVWVHFIPWIGKANAGEDFWVGYS